MADFENKNSEVFGENDDTEDFVEIYIFGNELNALSIKAVLEHKGIDVILNKVTNSMFPSPFDAVKLAVRESKVKEAKAIIQEVMSDQSKELEAELEAEAMAASKTVEGIEKEVAQKGKSAEHPQWVAQSIEEMRNSVAELKATMAEMKDVVSRAEKAVEEAKKAAEESKKR